MANSLAKYLGSLRATGGSPGIANLSKADKKLFAQSGLGVTTGKPKSRLAQAYQSNKRIQVALMNKLAKIK